MAVNSRIVGLSAMMLFAVTASACGASGSTPSATILLQKARSTLDSASAFHFTLSSSGAPPSGTAIVGGSGDLVRPDDMKGSFKIRQSGVDVSIPVVSVGNTFYAQLPFSSGYTKTNPSSFGLTNPSKLLSPSNGLSSLLTDVTPTAKLAKRERLSGELVDVVDGTVAGTKIPVLPDDDPAQPVQISMAIDPMSHQVRQVTLTGPLESRSADSTFTVTLSNYGEHVSIAIPPT